MSGPLRRDEQFPQRPAHRAQRSSPGGHDYDSTYEEVLLSDMTFEEEEGMYYWECPCGDMFEISQEELDQGQDIAHCPSCSLTLRVLLPPPPVAAETIDPEVKDVVQALTGLSTKEGE